MNLQFLLILPPQPLRLLQFKGSLKYEHKVLIEIVWAAAVLQLYNIEKKNEKWNEKWKWKMFIVVIHITKCLFGRVLILGARDITVIIAIFYNKIPTWKRRNTTQEPDQAFNH